MKKYTAEHKTKEIAENHISRIENRGGVAFLKTKGVRIIVDYAFPEIALPNDTLYKIAYFQDIQLGKDIIDISIVEFDKSLFGEKHLAKNRYFVLVNGNYNSVNLWQIRVNKYSDKNEYNNAGNTLADAKAIVKELNDNIINYKKNSVKIQESKSKGNNFYIRLEQKQESIKDLFNKYKHTIK